MRKIINCDWSMVVSVMDKSKKLTNHSRLFFSHSTVIDQFVTLTISSTIATAIVDHALYNQNIRKSTNQSPLFHEKEGNKAL